MTRNLALAAALFIALSASAVTRVKIDPPPPYFADETVRITVTRDDGRLPLVDVTGDNISIVRGDVPGTWLGTFYATSGSGQIVVHTMGPIEGPARLPFTLKPPLVQSWTDPDAEFQRLRAAGRPIVLIRAELQTPNPVPGQRVRIAWNVYYPFGMTEPRLGAETHDLPQGFEQDERRSILPGAMTPLSGAMMVRKELLAMTFTPKEPGRVTVPPVPFYGGDLRRISNMLEFDVRPVPPEATGLPIGPFTMNCTATESDWWPQAWIEVRGEGDVAAVRDFRFPSTQYAVIARPQPGQPGVFWIVAHSREISEIPKPTLRYFDPATNGVGEVTCADKLFARIKDAVEPADLKPHLHREAMSPPSRASMASSRPVRSPEEMRASLERGRMMAFGLAALGVLGLLAALRS